MVESQQTLPKICVLEETSAEVERAGLVNPGLTFEQINGATKRKIVKKRKFHLHPESIDKLSVVCFPLAFTVFNVRHETSMIN
ncbi:hypothetical protein AB6A40_010663 [Gnathostoma spinigerum]|uniref:Uncharacterized protein n=1 Tax=Gnathostoma spinigerum TaxID=75299 RepID=A0ABD6EVG7_9BILA